MTNAQALMTLFRLLPIVWRPEADKKAFTGFVYGRNLIFLLTMPPSDLAPESQAYYWRGLLRRLCGSL